MSVYICVYHQQEESDRRAVVAAQEAARRHKEYLARLEARMAQVRLEITSSFSDDEHDDARMAQVSHSINLSL